MGFSPQARRVTDWNWTWVAYSEVNHILFKDLRKSIYTFLIVICLSLPKLCGQIRFVEPEIPPPLEPFSLPLKSVARTLGAVRSVQQRLSLVYEEAKR